MNDQQRRTAADELAHFRQFADACELPIDMDSIQNRNPPEPDILCRVADIGWVAFELVGPIDERMAKATAQAPCRGGIAVDSYSEQEPLLENIRKKLRKRYESSASHLELVAHTGDLPVDFRPGTPHLLHALVSHDLPRSDFDRVWVFDGHYKKIFFVFPPLEAGS